MSVERKDRIDFGGNYYSVRLNRHTGELAVVGLTPLTLKESSNPLAQYTVGSTFEEITIKTSNDINLLTVGIISLPNGKEMPQIMIPAFLEKIKNVIDHFPPIIENEIAA